MYPFLLRDRSYPVARESVHYGMPVAQLVALASDHGVIARVRLRTRVPEYPMRTGTDTRYPTGTFTTVLTGPEIVEVSRDSEILQVYDCTTYRMGRPFVGVVDALLSERERCESAGDESGAQFAKLIVNALAGRLAIREGGWVRESELDCPGAWGERWSMSAKTGKSDRYRYIMGQCHRWQEDKLPRGPYTFAFAYLTAYGRIFMRRLREQLPERSVIAQVIDGLWVLPSGKLAAERLGWLKASGPGSVRVKDWGESARFWGPNHYRIDDRWTLSGFDYCAPPDERGELSYTTRTPLFAQRPASAPTTVRVCHGRTTLRLSLSGGRVQPDGWVLPPTLIPRKEI